MHTMCWNRVPNGRGLCGACCEMTTRVLLLRNDEGFQDGSSNALNQARLLHVSRAGGQGSEFPAVVMAHVKASTEPGAEHLKQGIVSKI